MGTGVRRSGVGLPARPALVLVGLLFPVFVLGACGRKGPPVPPRPAAPAAVGSLRAEARDSVIVVSWARPDRNEDGTPLTDLLEFRLYRAVGVAAPRGERGRPSFSLLATIPADQPPNATILGNQVAYQDDGGVTGLSPGARYTYRVQAVNRRGNAGPPSVEAFVDFALAPPPPMGLTATAGDGIVELTWQAPPGPAPAGSLPVRGYNVYRRVGSGAFASDPVNARPVLETRFRDAGVENDTTYGYVIRSVGTERAPWRESANSTEVSATPQDFTSPAPPRGLVAVPAAGAVALSWSPSPETDLLGYLVYRREPASLAPLRLTATPIQATTFADRTARSGATYIYTVTAVDRSPRRNESAPSSELEVSLP